MQNIFTFLTFLLNFLKTYVKVSVRFLYYFPLLWNAVDKQTIKQKLRITSIAAPATFGICS